MEFSGSVGPRRLKTTALRIMGSARSLSRTRDDRPVGVVPLLLLPGVLDGAAAAVP